jgi:oligoendopeptidase F
MTTIYKPTPWSLKDLFESYDSEDMNAATKDLDAKVAAFEAYRSKLSPDIQMQDFMEIIHDLEKINHLVYRIYGFASLLFASDTQDQNFQTFLAKVQQMLAAIENRVLFFSLWWKELDDEPAQRLLKNTGDYQYWLEEMRHFKPHTLTEAEEKIVNIKDTTGSKALQNLYDAITNRYVYKVNIAGEEKELTRGELMIYFRHHDPEIRSAAYQELYRIYGQDGTILGQMYQTLIRDWHNEQIDLRNFSSPISARNLINDIPDEVVDTLLDVCQRNAAVFQKFFALKARWLGVDQLRRYDLYAPVAKADKEYPFDEAVRMVLDSFENFEPKISELAQRVFDEDHLDSEVRKGKRDGAFCMTITPDLTPWVLLNYQGRANDVATMAHELGHAIHSMLAEHHSLFTQHACLPLAETASTFGEMVLIDRLLEQESDDNVRRDLLFQQVDDAYATILRQAFFAIFEREAHSMVAEGASVDQLSQTYLKNLRTQFGDSVNVSDEFCWEWVSIPHIYHVPFYVYAYTFGQLLVLSLYQQYKEQGEAFIPRYMDILSAGGSEAPVSILTKAGIDVYSDTFWQGGFDVIQGWVEKLEKLPIER